MKTLLMCMILIHGNWINSLQINNLEAAEDRGYAPGCVILMSNRNAIVIPGETCNQLEIEIRDQVYKQACYR